MTQKQQIQLFEEKKVRTVWDDELQEWFFSVVDVVEVLTDSKAPTDYLKKMRKREPQFGDFALQGSGLSASLRGRAGVARRRG